MNKETQETFNNAYGALKLIPGAIKIAKSIWGQIRPVPTTLEPEAPKDGIDGNDYYSADFGFMVSIPDDGWTYWKPSREFLTSMGPMFVSPTLLTPIMVLAQDVTNLFRQSVVVTVEAVGRSTNIEEMIMSSVFTYKQLGVPIGDNDFHVDNEKQSGMIAFAMPYMQNALYRVQHCYLKDGLFYVLTASYALPTSSFSKNLPGGQQAIMSSFKFLET